MEQTRALNALQPYLALSKSATSPRAAADVVVQATSAPHTYVFAELLSTPSIQNLKTAADPQHAAHYTLLEIFAWGTLEDYNANSSNLPPLSPTQHQKLLLLSLLTLASTAPSSSSLTYTHLQTSLSLSSPRELEKLVTEAIYNTLLTGTLDPKNKVVSISSVAPLRDLAPGSVGNMISELDAWSARCETVLADLEAEVARVKAEAAERREWEGVREGERKRAEKKPEKVNNNNNNAGFGGFGDGEGGGAGGEGGDVMDVDLDEDVLGGRMGRNRGGGGNRLGGRKR